MPIPVIISAYPGETDSREPVLNISIKAPDGSDRRMKFVFLQGSGAHDRSNERDLLLKDLPGNESMPYGDPLCPAAKEDEAEFIGSKTKETFNSQKEIDSFQRSPSRNVFHQPPPPPESSPSQMSGADPFRRSASRNVFRHSAPSFPQAASENPRRSYKSNDFSYENEPEIVQQYHRSDIGSADYSPSRDGFPSSPPPPPPPPPAFEDAQRSFDGVGFSDQSGPVNREYQRSYDPHSTDRVAPQYARRFAGAGACAGDFCPGPAGEFIYTPQPRRMKQPAQRRNSTPGRSSRREFAVGLGPVSETIIGMIRSPEEAFRQTKTKEVEDAVPVLLISLVIFAFGSTFFMGLIASSAGASTYPYLSGLSDIGTLIFVAIELIVFGAISVGLTGVLLHFVAYYEGFDKDITQSLKVAAYSSVPLIFGGLIPVFGVIAAPVWTIYLQYIGMRETFYMDSDQAIVAVLVPAAVFVAFFIIMVLLGGDNFSIFGGV